MRSGSMGPRSSCSCIPEEPALHSIGTAATSTSLSVIPCFTALVLCVLQQGICKPTSLVGTTQYYGCSCIPATTSTRVKTLLHCCGAVCITTGHLQAKEPSRHHPVLRLQLHSCSHNNKCQNLAYCCGTVCNTGHLQANEPSRHHPVLRLQLHSCSHVNKCQNLASLLWCCL
jgi:hypothetical protein